MKSLPLTEDDARFVLMLQILRYPRKLGLKLLGTLVGNEKMTRFVFRITREGEISIFAQFIILLLASQVASSFTCLSSMRCSLMVGLQYHVKDL